MSKVVLSILFRGAIIAVCFFAEADYAFYCQKLKECAEKYAVSVHAFVLMTYKSRGQRP